MEKANPSMPTLPGEVITFYSYKGGTGRSMLLANVAWQLASAGRRVLLIDWDLEAPGLHRYFKPFLGEDTELREQEGVLEWVTDYWEARLDAPDADVDALVRQDADPRHYVRKLQTQGYLSGGALDLMCAGRQDRHYAQSVSDFDWTRLYQKLDGAKFINAAKSILAGPGGYDYVLVDSRTGVSDTSGFCTVALADTLVVCFTYNNQSVIGASQIARDIKGQAQDWRARSSPSAQATYEPRRFRIFAVPSRVDDLDPERLERRQQEAWSHFDDLLTDVAHDQRAAYWGAVQIRNQALFAYEEVLAVCMNRPTDPQTVLGAVNSITRALTDDAFDVTNGLSDTQRRSLREQFSALSNTPSQERQLETAWTRFLARTPDTVAREAMLERSFGLLIQFFSVLDGGQSGGDPGSPSFVSSPLLSQDLTAPERQLAESLTAAGLVQRRITDDRQRGIAIADESVLAGWEELHQRLMRHSRFLVERDRVQSARRTWEAANRSAGALPDPRGEIAGFEFSDEQRAWLGRPNLLFLDALHEAAAARAREQSLVDRLDDASRFSQGFREEALARELGLSRRLRNVSVAALLVALGLYGVNWHAGTKSDRERDLLIADREAATRELGATKERLTLLEAKQQADRATLLYGQGYRHITGPARDRRYALAIRAFSDAIAADPGFAEAYRGRAIARSQGPERNVAGELIDWAFYYDLRPSLSGRTQLVVRALGESPLDDKLIADQLAKLRLDAAEPASRDTSPLQVANRLDGLMARIPPSLQGAAAAAIAALRGPSDSVAQRKPAAKTEEPRRPADLPDGVAVGAASKGAPPPSGATVPSGLPTPAAVEATRSFRSSNKSSDMLERERSEPSAKR